MLIGLEGVSHRFGRLRAVSDVSVELGTGVVGVVGRNGAGKTTLLRILATVLCPSSGVVRVDGRDAIAEPGLLRGRLGYLPQMVDFYPRMTGVETLRYVAGLKDVDRHDVNHALRLVNLTAEAGRRVGTYSGGMRRRLGLAQALMGSPELLVLDEPTYGLDPWERMSFYRVLAEFAQDHTVVFSTHVVADIERLAHQVLVLDAGKNVYWGSTGDLQKLVQGRVWQTRSEPTSGTLVGVTNSGGSLVYRVVSDAPPEQAEACMATLEDAFLALTARRTR